MVQLLWKTVWQFLKKLNIKWSGDLAIPLLDIYKTTESWDSNNVCTSMFTAALSTSQMMGTTPNSPVDEWINKIGINNMIEYYLALKEAWNPDTLQHG